MSADHKSPGQDYAEQLSDFETQLRHTMDDESLQQDVFRAIRELLRDHQESESDIRRILLERFDSGLIREETLQVVQGMLDQVVSEYDDTLPSESDADDGRRHTSTDVIQREEVDIADVSERLQPGSILRDRFLLQQKVSGGSMGDVYKALDRRLAEVDGVEPWVAIKVLTPKLSRNADALRALQQEAAKGRCLAHPNIVRFIDLDREEDAYFLVMEWIEGRSLAAVLDDPEIGRLDQTQIGNILRQLAAALDYAHRSGVVHADVKPGNVMVMPDGQVKLIDFGVARIRQRQKAEGAVFDPGVLGAATPAYSSMQVLTGEDPAPADDVFSLACLAYRLIAGYRVFGPRNAAEAAEEGMSPQQPAGLDDRQWRPLKKALSFARVTRYSSPLEFVEEFLDPAGPVPAVPVVEDASIDPAAAPRSGARTVALLVFFLVVAAAGAWYSGLVDDYLPGVGASGIGRSARPAAPGHGEPVGRREGPALPAGADVADPGDNPDTPAANQLSGTTAESVADPVVADDADVEPAAVASALGNGTNTGEGVPDNREGNAISEPPADVPLVPATEATPADPVPDSVPTRSPATHTLALGRLYDQGITALTVVLREDGEPAVIDLLRTDAGESLDVTVEELSSGGNRSAWEAGQYVVQNDGRIAFPPGTTTAQLVISMTSDPVREPDRDVELGLRDTQSGDELGIIDLRLEDDDQRAFEAILPVNTVGFAVSQVSVGEGETAAQIDLVRYKPDATVLTVPYRVQDVTATMDDDYFAPESATLTFEANSRSARILVPLVQDAEVERDEAFFIELDGPPGDDAFDIYRRIAVMIRDDDS